MGGLGLHAYGHSRATFDLDLVTRSEAQAPLVVLLEELGYETVHRSPGYSNHSHTDPEWGGIDIVYVDEGTARQLFSAGTRTLRLGDREVPVPSAEHFIAMKVQALATTRQASPRTSPTFSTSSGYRTPAARRFGAASMELN